MARRRSSGGPGPEAGATDDGGSPPAGTEPPAPTGAPQVAEDAGLQEATWTFQRVGWAIMGAIVVAALAGVFGEGPLAHASAHRAGVPLIARHDRFARALSPARLTVEAWPDAGRDGRVRLWVDGAFLDRVEIRRITPEPERVEAEADGLALLIATARPPTPAGAPVTVQIDYEPEGPGLLRCRLGVPDRPALTLDQWVYP